MNKMGFYKNEDGVLVYAPDCVLSPDFVLISEEKDLYSYPIGGWYWFDDEDNAYLFFNLEKPIIDNMN